MGNYKEGRQLYSVYFNEVKQELLVIFTIVSFVFMFSNFNITCMR